MGSAQRTLEQLLSGNSDAIVGFNDLRNLLLHLGFEERVRASHHIFRRSGIRELINLQRDGNSAKPYQVKQVRRIITEYGLGAQQ